MNPITSKQDWHDSFTRLRDEHPLHGLPSETVAEFTDSLEMKNGRFAHAYYGGIREHLDDHRFEKVLGMLGLSIAGFGLIKDTACGRDGGGGIYCKPMKGWMCNGDECHEPNR